MSHHRLIALTLMSVGVAALILSIWSLVTAPQILAWGGVLLGAALIVGAMFVLVAELMERWLSKSQSALVDGLQAG